MSENNSDTGDGETTEVTANEICVQTEPRLETEFTIKTWRDDVTLIVEDKPLYVNKGVLVYASPVFDAMFSGNFEEKDKTEIPLPGKKFEDFQMFLLCIHPGRVCSMKFDTSNVYKILPLAHEYQVENLESECINYLEQLLTMKESLTELYQIMKVGSELKLDKLVEKCIEIVITDYPENKCDEFKNEFAISDEAMNSIRGKVLKVMKTKYTDVFGHAKTSRILYQFLAHEAKQTELLEKCLNGNLVGDVACVKVDTSTCEGTSELVIGGETIIITCDKVQLRCLNYQSCLKITLKWKSTCTTHMKNGVCAVYLFNWMKGKENKSEVNQLYTRNTEWSCNLQTLKSDELCNEESGFNYKGFLKMKVFVFYNATSV